MFVVFGAHSLMPLNCGAEVKCAPADLQTAVRVIRGLKSCGPQLRTSGQIPGCRYSGWPKVYHDMTIMAESGEPHR